MVKKFNSIQDIESSILGGSADGSGEGGAGALDDQINDDDVSLALDPIENSSPPKADPSVEPPAYVPNFRFRVGDQEVELDERVRGLVKDKASEEYFHDLYKRFHEYDPLKRERDTYATHYEQVQQSLQNLQEWRSKDPWKFFQATGIRHEDILAAAERIRAFQSLPQEQQQAYQQQITQQQQFQNLQQQHTQLQQTFVQQQVQVRDTELQTLTGSQMFSDAQKAFDERMGSPGAFWNSFKMLGHQMSQQEKAIASPFRVFEAMKQAYPGMFTAQQQMQQQPAPQTNQQKGASSVNQPPATTRTQAKPIPNVGSSGGAAPVKRKWNSIEDIEKSARERSEEDV